MKLYVTDDSNCGQKGMNIQFHDYKNETAPSPFQSQTNARKKG